MKRQIETQGVINLWEPEALDVDPFYLPAVYKIKHSGWTGKYFKAYDEVRIGSYSVNIRHYISGYAIANKRLCLSEFSGVAIRVSLLEPEYKFAISINLHHEQQQYCIPLHFAYDMDVSVARVQSWGRQLKLPVLVTAVDGTWQEPIGRLGRLLVKPTIMRHPQQYLCGRKPIFSKFRDVGEPHSKETFIQGREMIARE